MMNSTQYLTPKWILLEKYCQLTGDTKEAVYARRKKGNWLDGVQCVLVRRRIRVCLAEVDQWIQKNSGVKPSVFHRVSPSVSGKTSPRCD